MKNVFQVFSFVGFWYWLAVPKVWMLLALGCFNLCVHYGFTAHYPESFCVTHGEISRRRTFWSQFIRCYLVAGAAVIVVFCCLSVSPTSIWGKRGVWVLTTGSLHVAKRNIGWTKVLVKYSHHYEKRMEKGVGGGWSKNTVFILKLLFGALLHVRDSSGDAVLLYHGL